MIRLTTPSPLNAANPRILQRVYDVLGALFRDLARDILAASDETSEGGLQSVWEIVRRGLGAPAKSTEVEAHAMEVEPTPTATEAIADDDVSDDEVEDAVVEEPVASTSARQIDVPSEAPKLHTSLPANFRTTPQTRRLLGNAFALLVRKAKPTSSEDVEPAAGGLDGLMQLMIRDVAAVEEEDGGERANGGRSAKGRRKGKGKGRGQEEGSSNIFAEGLTYVVIESCSVSFCSRHQHPFLCFNARY